MRWAWVVLLVAAIAFADPRDIYTVRDGQIVLIDGSALDIRGGAYLTSEALQSTAKELERLRAENKSMKEAPPPESISVKAVIVSVLVGLVVGGVVVVLIKK